MTDGAQWAEPSTYSVVIGTFNGARFIREQVESVLQQSIPPTEVVIADDGSTDGTIEVIESVMRDWGLRHSAPRVTILTAPFGNGVAKNFERGMRAATCPVLALADQDDIWHTDRISVALALLLSSPDVHLVTSDASLVDSDGATLGRSLFGELSVSPGELERLNGQEALASQLRRNVVAGMSFLFKRELLNQALPIPDGWMHDHWLATIAASMGGMRVTPKALVDYRQHESNLIGAGRRTLLYKARRVVQGRSDSEITAGQFSQLVARIENLAATVQSSNLHLALNKAQFEQQRANLSVERSRRFFPIFRMVLAGQYVEFASNGNLNAIRDLVQRGPHEG